jgi:translation initiation factor 2-alpha kinase 4
LSLSDHCVDQLCNFIFHEGEFHQQALHLRCITKTTGQAGSLAKKGLHELEAFLSHMETLGCKFPPILSVGLLSNIKHFSGVMFQVVYDVKRNNRTTVDVLAAGGRYDRLLTHFRKPGTTPSQSSLGVVGVSIAYDKIVSAAMEKGAAMPVPTLTDALVCSLGHRSVTRELLTIVKELWAVGVLADIYIDGTQSLEEIKDYCRENHISHLILQKDCEISLIKLQLSEKDRVVKKDLGTHELTDYFQFQLRNQSSRFSDSSDALSTKSGLTSSLGGYISDNTGNPYGSSCVGSGNTGSGGIGSGSSGSGVGGSSSGNPLPQYDISFVLPDNNKLAKNTKRSYESQTLANVTPTLARFNSRCRVEVLGVELGLSVIKSMAVHLDFRDEDTLAASISPTVKEYPRHKKYLAKIVNEISDLKFENNKQSPVIILYSIDDDAHRALL